MLQRDIAVLIAGALLSVQVTWAAADQGAFPSSDNETYSGMTPALIQYLDQRAASNPRPVGASGSVFPFSAASIKGASNPDQDKYLAEQARRASAEPNTVRINAATREINVEHLQRVKIENDKGQSFVWLADTLDLGQDSFPLQAVAPKNFAAGNTRVYLTHPHEHMLHN